MAMRTQLPGSTTIGSPMKMVDTAEPQKNTIPLVSHILTDEDIGALQGAKMQPINLHKVIKLLTDPHSAMLIDRHIHALRKVVKHYSPGFVMKDLVLVFKLLNVCADRVEEHPMYTDPMVDILKICRQPFLKEKMSDETSYEQIAVESVSQLGYLMRVPSKEVRHQICQTLVRFYTSSQLKQEVTGHKPSTLEYNKNIIESSDVAETLVKSLTLLESDLDIRLSVLDVLQKLSKDSVKNCDMMLNAEAAYRLCSRLMDYDPSGQLLFVSVDILWNLLENGSKDKFAAQLNNVNCISQLRDAFIHQLTQGFSHYDRQLRNDLLVVSTLVASVCPDAPFVETGFTKQITLFTTFQEVKSHNALVKHLKLLKNHEDFEMKKLLINMLVVLSQGSAVLPLLSEGHLLLALFSYVRANEKTSQPQDWSVAQFEEIQLHALSALCTLAPLLLEDYMTCQGGTRLLLLLEWCVGPDKFGGHGNSFHGLGGRGNKKAQMRQCLRLIRSMVSTENEAVLQDFVDQGAISQLTAIVSSIQEDEERSRDDAVDVEMQTDMLFILSCLCDNDMHRKELFGNQGVDIVAQYLKTDPLLLNSGLGHHQLMLATVNCIWCSVVGCYVTEDYFLEKEGVFLLIDLLEHCPKNMHNLIVGCLLDLCENHKTVPHIITWHGQNDQSAAHLLCDIWRQEERDMGVPRAESSSMADSDQPLMGLEQRNQQVTPLPAKCPSRAIVDVSENMRAKIYALFCKLGFVELPGLTTEDHITLTVIEHYMDFKSGEVWSELIAELEEEHVRPITPDAEAIEAINRTIKDRADHVLEVQKELLDAQNQQDIIDEQEFYAEIRENHRQKEKAISDFHEFVARTSNYMLLKAAKERQEMSVDASRVQTGYKNLDQFHSTDLQNLHTTVFSGRHVEVESTPAELTGGTLVNYNPATGTLTSRTLKE